MTTTNLPQTQQSLEKHFFQQIQPGDFIDARYTEKEWKLAKVIDKQNKYLTIMFDGYQSTQQIYMHSFKVSCLRYHTMGYTGPVKGFHSSFISIPDLNKHIEIMDNMVTSEQPPSAFKVTQYLRGQLFVGVNSLLLSELPLSEDETKQIYKFLLRFIEKVMKMCVFAKEHAGEYFESQTGNKVNYLANYKFAILFSLQQLLYLVFLIVSPEMPKLLKAYKSQIPQENLASHLKQSLQNLINIFHINDGSGKWMPTEIRIQAIKILIRFKKQDQLTFALYELKDYQQFHNFWPWVLKSQPSQQYEESYINFMIKALINPTPFDAKLKSLQMLRKVVEKEIKFVYLSTTKVVEQLMRKQVLEALLNLNNFNSEILKRYIPIVQVMTQNYSIKKYFSNVHIDLLFHLMKTRHQSEANLIQEIIVNISEFINLDLLDYIFHKIEQQGDLNSESSIKFIRQFTIKAVRNYNSNANRGIIGALFGRKKCSQKYGFYGLNLFWKEIHDVNGKIKKPLIDLSINSIGILFQNDAFASERNDYMLSCIHFIEKKNSFGQCIRILKEIVKSYPTTSLLGDNQLSVVDKLDEKHHLLDTFIKGLISIQSQKESSLKIPFSESLKYFYQFLQEFEENLKYPLKINHIEELWKYPHLFEYLRKVKEIQSIPSWKKKYFKKINSELMKQILSKIVIHDKNLFLNAGFYDSIDELFMAYHYGLKNIDITERSTIRYRTIKGLVGLDFYYKFIEKLLRQKKQNKDLFRKVATRILQIHLRPIKYEDIAEKCSNWLYGLMTLMKLLRNDPSQCMFVVQYFLQQIKGRNFKDISASGMMQILVSYNGLEKNISIQRNATIFKFRKSLMSAFSLKCNFIMYNHEMKRQITYNEEEDFSVNAMNYRIKGPSIYIKKVQEGVSHPLLRAKDQFISIIQNQNEFYSIIFELLQKLEDTSEGKEIQHKIWKLIENLPTNKAIIKKIEKCQKFNEKNWQQFLKVETTDHLQYSLKIIYELMGSVEWTYNLQKTKGLHVLELLFIKFLENRKEIQEKTLTQLTKIHLKGVQLIKIDDIKTQNMGKVLENLKKLISQVFQMDVVPYNIETINLLMKYVLVCWKKINLISQKQLILYFNEESLLSKIAQFGLFLPREVDTSYFVDEILGTVCLKLFDLEDKKTFFQVIVQNYLKIDLLSTKKSTQNYFLFIIDIISSLKPEEEEVVFTSLIQEQIKEYIGEIIFAKDKKQMISLDSELVFGCLKMLSLFQSLKISLNHSQKQIFDNLLEKFVFEENRTQNLKGKKSIKTKNKKILYDVVKKMIFSSEQLLQIFVQRLEEPLAKGNWRKNTYSSWSLEQPKNDKKFFCGLENLAATCYINCLFQQLFMINRFRDRFISVNSLSYRETYEENQIFQLQKILAFLKYGNKKSYTTRPFCESFITYEGLPIDPTVQSDADEFFNALMEKVESFLKATNQHQILEDTFEGKLSNQLNGEGCPHNSQKVQSFSSIGLNIKNKKTLEEALDGYVEGQILDGDNAYFCELCEKKVRTMKRLCIKELPNILVVVLKRFTYNFDEMKKIKINDQLKYPQAINMKKYTSEYLQKQEEKPDDEYDYNLRGVVVHSGTSEGGHYYSFIKQKEKWFEFNDENIEEAEVNRIEEEGFGGEQKDTQFRMEKHKNAYILFYEKKKQRIVQNNMKMQEEQSFDKELSDIVLTDNKNADFLAILLDHLFVRLCENIAMSEFLLAKKFILLYFHSVLLRDRHHDDYLVNIYRLILTLMEDKDLSEWFVSQINHHYITEFLIQSPRMMRYLCTGLVLHAIKKIDILKMQNLDNFLSCLIFCVQKKGMTPFGKVLSHLSKLPEIRKKLEQLQYPQRILNILLSKKIPTKSIIYEEKESYFGKDSSQKLKQTEFCHVSLIQSLKYYSIESGDALKLLEQYHSRGCSKTMAQILIKNCESSEQAQRFIKSLQAKALSQKSKKQEIEQYLFMTRFFFLGADQHPDYADDIKQICLQSLRLATKESDCYYIVMELLIVQLNKIARQSGEFKKMWKMKVAKDEKLRKAIQFWVRESDRPHFMSRSQEWKRKVINLSYNEKQILINENKVNQEKRTGWMIEESILENAQIYSEIDEVEIGKEAIVGFKSARVMDHLGLMTKVESDKQNKWAIIQKNQIDVYSWL